MARTKGSKNKEKIFGKVEQSEMFVDKGSTEFQISHFDNESDLVISSYDPKLSKILVDLNLTRISKDVQGDCFRISFSLAAKVLLKYSKEKKILKPETIQKLQSNLEIARSVKSLIE